VPNAGAVLLLRTAEAVGLDAALSEATATARARAWELAGDRAPDRGRSAADPLVIDVDATLVTAHSEKESAAPTFKRGFGFIRSARSSTTGARAPGSR
jgi:hypothetical protein